MANIKMLSKLMSQNSYWDYVQSKGFNGKKIFDKYGDLSKQFKKFVVEKEGKINLPQDWVYLPERATYKFIYKPTASKRVINKLEERKTNIKYSKIENKKIVKANKYIAKKQRIASIRRRCKIVEWKYVHRFKDDKKNRWYGPFEYNSVFPSHYDVYDYSIEWLERFEQNNSIKETRIIDGTIKVRLGPIIDAENMDVANINMFHGSNILKYEGMRGIGDVSYQEVNKEKICVYRLWENRYGKFPVIKTKLFSVLEKKYPGLKKEDGVSPNMLLFACQEMKISFYAFNVMGKRICKHCAHNSSHYPVLVCYCANEHMYLVTDEDEITSIIKSNADKVNYTSKLMEKEDDKLVEREYTEYIVKHSLVQAIDKYGEDVLEEVQDYNINQLEGGNSYIYQGPNLNEIFRELYMKKGIIAKVNFKE